MKKLIDKISALIKREDRLGELIRFGLVGGSATLIQYGMYVVFAIAVGTPAIVATMISYGISFVFNYVMSNYFTFRTKPNTGGGIGFALSHLINMGLQVGFVAVFNLIVPKSIVLLPAMAICIPINYLMVRHALTNQKVQDVLSLKFMRKSKTQPTDSEQACYNRE